MSNKIDPPTFNQKASGWYQEFIVDVLCKYHWRAFTEEGLAHLLLDQWNKRHPSLKATAGMTLTGALQTWIEAEDGSKADKKLLDWLDSNFVKIELGNGMEPILAVEDLRTAIVARKKRRPF